MYVRWEEGLVLPHVLFDFFIHFSFPFKIIILDFVLYCRFVNSKEGE